MQRDTNQKVLTHMAFINRENSRRHHYYNEELRQYQLMKDGDEAAIDESVKMFSSQLTGHLSDNPLRNLKYLFVASITLCTRFSIEGGLDSETAYNISDLYIQRVDKCESENQVRSLHKEMFAYFTHKMAALNKEKIVSLAVSRCLDEIDLHLHENITLAELAQAVKLHPSYLSELFHKETGTTISEYTASRKIEAACNMLRYSEYTSSEIASFLGFSTQSYFIKVFQKHMGVTPKVYKNEYYETGFEYEAPKSKN